MDLDWVESFLAVVDRGGFTAAAAHVHRSQSRVSSHVAGLERALGVQLIDRAKRPAAPTSAGDTFARHARKMMWELSQARSSLDALKAADGNSAVIVSEPGVGAAVLPDLLARLLLRRPGTRVTLAETGWPVEAMPGEPLPNVAVAIVPTRAHPLPAGLHERVLWRETMKVVLPAGHQQSFSGRPLTLERLSRYPLIVTSNGRPDADLVSGQGPDPTPNVVIGSPQLLVELVRRHAGIGLEYAVALHTVDTDGLVLLDIDHPAPVREVAAYWYDSLLNTEVGRALHQLLMKLPPPTGALCAGEAPRRQFDGGVDAEPAGQGYVAMELLPRRLS